MNRIAVAAGRVAGASVPAWRSVAAPVVARAVPGAFKVGEGDVRVPAAARSHGWLVCTAVRDAATALGSVDTCGALGCSRTVCGCVSSRCTCGCAAVTTVPAQVRLAPVPATRGDDRIRECLPGPLACAQSLMTVACGCWDRSCVPYGLTCVGARPCTRVGAAATVGTVDSIDDLFKNNGRDGAGALFCRCT